MRRTATKAALTLSLLLGATARGAEEPIAADKVPEAAMKAVKAKFPGAKITETAKEEDEGKTVYEVTLTHEGSKYDVTASPEGTIVCVERTIAPEKLPKPVSAAIAEKYPAGKIKIAEEIIKGTETNFEVLLSIADGKEVELVYSPDGQLVKEEKDKEKEREGEEKPKDKK